MKNKILIITQTHGDECIGTEVMKKLKSGLNKKFRWVIANKKADFKSKRFIKFDMNRIAPGNIKSKNYEQRRVAEIISLSKKYAYTIDIHGTEAISGIFIIVTKPTIQNILFALSLPIKNVVIWSPRDIGGPITKFVPCGLEIECGPQALEKTKNYLFVALKKIEKQGIDYGRINFRAKNIFKVYGKLLKNKIAAKSNLKDFKQAIISKEIFYPLLCNRYAGVSCYKMEKVNFVELLSY